MMLSSRGQVNADQLDIPWRFAQGTTYHPETNPSGVISFATAEVALVQQELKDFANKVGCPRDEKVSNYSASESKHDIYYTQVHIPGDAFLYKFSSAGGPRFPAALATHLNEYFRPHEPLVGSDIGVTSAATALHEVLAYSLAESGEGILTSRPTYGRFELDFGNKAQLKVVYAETQAETCFQSDVVEAFEKALVKSNTEGVKIRALLVVNPHNPLGEIIPGRLN
jgi:1-aminocyclopropane-1-carboxylate synthase